MEREQLVEIYRDTVRICQEGGYTNSLGERIDLGTSGPNGPYRLDEVFNALANDKCGDFPFRRTEIEVQNVDTVLAGKELLGKGFRPAILNMGSTWHPGGGVERGSRTQEESLFRRSTLCQTLAPLKNFCYPFFNFPTVIYSPNAIFFRGPESEGCRLLDRPLHLPVVTTAAVDNSDRKHDKSEFSCGPSHQIMVARLMHLFSLAVAKGHDALVLGALGCGAYGNPPDKVAETFKQVLGGYAGMFAKIVFAVLDRHAEDRNGNYQTFKRALDGCELVGSERD